MTGLLAKQVCLLMVCWICLAQLIAPLADTTHHCMWVLQLSKAAHTQDAVPHNRTTRNSQLIAMHKSAVEG
jgi:hypothetical protein